MTEQLISLKTAQLAKEVGFNWRVQFYYNHKNTVSDDGANLANYNQDGLKTLSAPTQNFLQKWIREVHNIYASASPVIYAGDLKASYFQATINNNTINHRLKYDIFEDALETALYQALLLIKTIP